MLKKRQSASHEFTIKQKQNEGAHSRGGLADFALPSGNCLIHEYIGEELRKLIICKFVYLFFFVNENNL